MVNTTNRNIWIRQPLLATEEHEVELHPWQQHIVLNGKGNTIKIGLQAMMPPAEEQDLDCHHLETEIEL